MTPCGGGPGGEGEARSEVRRPPARPPEGARRCPHPESRGILHASGHGQGSREAGARSLAPAVPGRGRALVHALSGDLLRQGLRRGLGSARQAARPRAEPSLRPGRGARARTARAPHKEAERRLDAAYSDLRHGAITVDADVFLCFALASLELAAKSSHPPLHYERALEIAELGIDARLDATQARPDLRVVRTVAKDLLAGRTPTLDAFYRAGRGDLVARASPEERKDPVRLLTGSMRALGPLPRAA